MWQIINNRAAWPRKKTFVLHFNSSCVVSFSERRERRALRTPVSIFNWPSRDTAAETAETLTYPFKQRRFLSFFCWCSLAAPLRKSFFILDHTFLGVQIHNSKMFLDMKFKIILILLLRISSRMNDFQDEILTLHFWNPIWDSFSGYMSLK